MKVLSWCFTILLVLGGVFFLLHGIALVVGVFPQPKHVAALDGTAIGALRDAPNWVVGIGEIILGFAFSIPAFFPVLGGIDRRRAKQFAWAVAKRGWYVQQADFLDSGAGILNLSSSDGTPVQSAELFFRSHHPDAARLRSLSRMSHVRFRYTDEKPGDWGLGGEITSYLRLQSTGHL